MKSRKPALRHGLALIALAILGGCRAPDAMHPVARVGVQDLGFAEPALARSVNAFLGNPAGSDAPGGGLPRYPYTVETLHEASIGATARWELGQGSATAARFLVGKGQTRITFPDGVEIFVDPLTVAAETTFVEAGFLVEQSLSCPCLLSDRTSIFAEAGHRRTWSDITLRSALIARDDSGTDSQTFAGVGLRFDLGARRGTSLDFGLRKIVGSATALRLGLEKGF